MIFVALGLALLLFPGIVKAKSQRNVKRFALFYITFAVLWTIGASYAVFSQYYQAKSAVVKNSFEIVDGPVEHFHPMPATGHQMETFDVKGKHFAYSDYFGCF